MISQEFSSTPSSPTQSHNEFTYWVGVCFAVNYILGSGFLTLPWAISQSGILVGAITLIIFSMLSTSSSHMYLVVLERTYRVLLYFNETSNNKENLIDSDSPLKKCSSSDESNTLDLICPSSRRLGYLPIDNKRQSKTDNIIQLVTIQNPLVKNNILYNNVSQIDEDYMPKSPESNGIDDTDKLSPNSTKIQLENVDLILSSNLFLGKYGKRFYLFMVSIYTYGCLWAYATVFANSFSAHLNFFGSYSYYVYLFIFSLFTVPLSLMELNEQINIQVLLTLFRIIMVVFMVGTTIQAVISDNNSFGDEYSPYNEANELHYSETISKVKFDKMHNLLPIAAYSFIFHHSISSLSAPIKNKKLIPSIFSMALFISMVSYVLVGIVLSIYFGDNTETSSNLNWLYYVGISNKKQGLAYIIARFISFFIVLFPAIDVASAYPLNAFTLGNNLKSAFNDNETNDSFSSNISFFNFFNIPLNKENKVKFFRILSSVPPIIFSLFERDLGKITDITGLLAFPLAFIYPSIILFASKNKLRELNLKETRDFNNLGCHIGDETDQESDVYSIEEANLENDNTSCYPSDSNSPRWGYSLTLWVSDYVGYFNIIIGSFIFFYISYGLVVYG